MSRTSITLTVVAALALAGCAGGSAESPDRAAQLACQDFARDRIASPSTAEFAGSATRHSPGTDRYTVTGSVNGGYYKCEVVAMSDGHWSLVHLDGLTPTTPPAPPTSQPTTPPTSTPPPGPADTIGQGTYVVGVDIQAGTYKTTGPAGSSSCYWARLKDTTGDGDSLLANDLTDGPSTVTIKKSDGAFETRRCAVWQKVG